MKKILVLQFTLLLLSVYAFATPISESEAREKAVRFIHSKKGTSAARSAQRFGGAASFGATLTSVESQEAYYVFNVDSVNGYVIVSGDDRMPDVLGYSYHGTYNAEDIPDNMRAWLQGYADEYQYLQTHGDAKGASLTAVKGDAVLPLLECTWSQHFPYNDLCPKINGKNAVTGCVATAMAQVMYYHKWPKQTTKVIPAYTTKSEGIYMSQIGITTIDWDNMAPSYGYYGGTSAQNQAVAELMLLCGCAVQMDYTLDGSGAYCSPAALTDYFGYNKLSISEVIRSRYSSDVWNQMIYDEVKEDRPVLYSGDSSSGGHQFVIDGYDEKDYFHVNWGWGGYQDSYFLLSSLNGYNSGQRAIIGIEGQGDTNHKYAYAELVGETLTFYYDNKRETRTGTMFKVNSHEWTGDEYKSKITTVKFDSSFGDYKYMSDTGYMFSDMENLTSIQGLEYLNTQNVTNMGSMFYNCSSLTSLDVSNFNTQNVTSMSWMFSNCSNLTSLDVSRFDTQNVTSMRCMFYGCKNLTSLDVSNFNTQNVTDMLWMFYNCSSLTSLDVSNFDTQNVTDMRYMFFNCSSLTSLDVSKFDTQNVTDMSCMFSGCSSLTSLDVSKFDTQNVTSMGSMFSGCSSITSLDVSKFDTKNVTDMGSMFSGCSNLSPLDVSNFETKNVTDMSWMFYNCSSLISLDVSNFNTQKVTDMSGMFYNCSSFTSLDVSRFDTQNVTDMGSMFSGCSSLTSIDISSFDTQKVTSMSWMFSGCSSLQDIYPGEKWSTQNVENGNYMFSGCYNLIGERGTQYSYSNSDYTYAHIDGGTDNPGYFSTKGYSYPYIVISNDSKTLTFYYGSGRNVTGSIRLKNYSYYTNRDWNSVTASLKTVVFDKSFADYNDVSNTSYWFYNCENLTTIQGLENLNTQNVTDMRYMFYGCKNLTSLDVSNFDTRNVESMNYMFCDCSSLISLDVRKFNTQNVTSLSGMFFNCKNLTSLDVSNFDTRKVTNMYCLFYNCSNLRSLDVCNFDTKDVTNMGYMFCGCSSLETIYAGEKWNTASVENSDYMFGGCSNLVGQDGTKYNYYYMDKTKAHYGAGGYLTYKSPVLRGDANGDGEIGMPDVMFIVNYILGSPDASFNTKAADANKDGEVGMPDVMFIVNYILNGEFPEE